MSPGNRRRAWEKSFSHTIDEWREQQRRPRFCFLTMHLSWQVGSQFFSPLSWRHPPDYNDILVNFLRDEFKPQSIITFIDDIYSAQYKIRKDKYHFRLLELLRWRNVETLLADTLAQQVVPAQYFQEDRDRYPFEHSPVVAIRHPKKMLYTLLTDKMKPRVYASYPISEPREMAEKLGTEEPIKEINHFREFMHDQFVVFDPVTIDERPLEFIRKRLDKEFYKKKKDKLISTLYKARNIKSNKGRIDHKLNEEIKRLANTFLKIKEDTEISLLKGDRWPTEGEDTLCGDDPVDIENLSLKEIAEITSGGIAGAEKQFSEIDRQIQSRDYRLIEQADYVVVYRPTLNKDRWSTGTFSEANYAHFVGREVFVIRDRKDTPLNSPPFGMDLPEFNVFEGKNLSNRDPRKG